MRKSQCPSQVAKHGPPAAAPGSSQPAFKRPDPSEAVKAAAAAELAAQRAVEEHAAAQRRSVAEILHTLLDAARDHYAAVRAKPAPTTDRTYAGVDLPVHDFVASALANRDDHCTLPAWTSGRLGDTLPIERHGRNRSEEFLCYANDILPDFNVQVDAGLARVTSGALRLHLALAWAAAELDCVSEFAVYNKPFTVNSHQYTLRLDGAGTSTSQTVSQQPPTPPPPAPKAPPRRSRRLSAEASASEQDALSSPKPPPSRTARLFQVNVATGRAREIVLVGAQPPYLGAGKGAAFVTPAANPVADELYSGACVVTLQRQNVELLYQRALALCSVPDHSVPAEPRLLAAANEWTACSGSSAPLTQANLRVRPFQLTNWLLRLKELKDGPRTGFCHFIIAKHGTSAQGIAGINSSIFGFDPGWMASSNGNARGTGAYLSLDDRLCEHYNRSGTSGKGVLCLMIVPRKRWSRDTMLTHYSLFAQREENNALVAHDMADVIALGDVSRA
jgi:hypothetical protein